ncbi:IclR family transcriptional regulator [Desmospora activa]|uniref:IclR family transcriptional regulator n=1 Tax=Desmospora activa DSM 45169 TaxID=1121389 RepID=A0A2T4Z956_9BACL|nr:IclR family transcriptional regulator [Desmospora activa]PTM58424.1 IclR family transcriptional regulator [Desmospora activa DSM 45169]
MTTETKSQKGEAGLRTVQRAIDILYCFTHEVQELSLTEIANHIQLAKSTTTRLLATLEQNDLIQKDPATLKYRLGHGMYYLGHIAGRSIQIREIAKPIMERLRDNTNETVNLYLLDQDRRSCIEQSEGLQSVRHLVKIGERLPLWAGAGGKVILAYQSTELQRRIFTQVPSAAQVNALQKELPNIRSRGSASSLDEREVGSAAVAAPIFDINGDVKACLSVSGPTNRFTPEFIEQLHVQVRDEAMTISKQLGFVETRDIP